MSRPLACFAALALALVAVSLLVFQPICEAGEFRVPQGESCCAIGTAAPVQAASAAAEEAGCAIPEASAGLPAFRPQTLIAGAVASGAALPVSRYHARSARIQR